MTISSLWLAAGFNLIIGLVLGNILYRGDFCIAGILRDQFLFRDRTLLRPLLLAVGLTLSLFTLVRYTGMLPATPPPTFGTPSLTGIAGGWLFGIGMVLAGGCVISTLYKMGGGNLSHSVAFMGIVAGSVLYAELQPLFDRLYSAGKFTEISFINQKWPLAAEVTNLLVMLFTVFFALRWYRASLLKIVAAAHGYLQPWKIAVWLALLNLSAYLVNGWPLGISKAYLNIGVWLETQLFPAHVLHSPTIFQQTRLTMMNSTGEMYDPYMLTELPLMAGILAGSLLTAVFLKEFNVYGLPPCRQGLSAFTGGILMALGARMSNGCNIKFMLGGLPLLSIEAVLFVSGMLLGAWHGAKLLPLVITPITAKKELLSSDTPSIRPT